MERKADAIDIPASAMTMSVLVPRIAMTNPAILATVAIIAVHTMLFMFTWCSFGLVLFAQLGER